MRQQTISVLDYVSGSPNKKEYVIWDFGILLFNLILFILGLRLRGFAASLKKTQVQGQSSPERRLSEEQKERLKKQVSIWAERTRKDVTDEG